MIPGIDRIIHFADQLKPRFCDDAKDLPAIQGVAASLNKTKLFQLINEPGDPGRFFQQTVRDLERW